MTTRSETIMKAFNRVAEMCSKANEDSNKVYEKLEKGIVELTDFARSIGRQAGMGEVLSMLGELYDEVVNEEIKDRE